MGDSPSDRFKKPFRFECQKCGKCCSDKNTLVNVTFRDIDRMQQSLNLDLNGLLQALGFYIFDTQPTPDQIKKMVIPPIQTERGFAFLALKKNPDGKCIYLDEQNLCKIYDVRPDICRTFPFHFHSTPKVEPEARLDIEMSYTMKAKEYCPGIGSPAPEINPEFWMSLGRDTITHILSEHLLVKKYNEAVSAKKIIPTARNYLLTMIELNKLMNAPERKKKMTYQARVREKLQKVEEDNDHQK